jgi:hypothetical protein
VTFRRLKMYTHPVSVQCSDRVCECGAFSAVAEIFYGCPDIEIFESQVPIRPLIGMWLFEAFAIEVGRACTKSQGIDSFQLAWF